MFERIKKKVSRRLSEPAIFDLPALPFAGRRALTSTNRTVVILDEPHPRHSALVSRLRALSVLSQAPDAPRRLRLVLKKQARELVKFETSQVVGKKLLSLLSDLGLQQPFPLSTTNNSTLGPLLKLIRCFVANTNDCIYLPPALLASFTYDDVENGGAHVNEDIDTAASDAPDGHDTTEEHDDHDISGPEHASLPLPSHDDDSARRAFELKLQPFNSPNYLSLKIDSDAPIPHVFAFIIELTKETSIREVRFEFQLCVLTLWPTGDPHNHYHHKEKYKIGQFEWLSSLSDADYYINTQNSNDAKIRKIDPNELAKRSKRYRLVKVRDLADDNDPINNSKKSFSLNPEFTSLAFSDAMSISSSGIQENAKAGLYVFLLPLIFPSHMPASVTSINGSLNHRLTMNMIKMSDKLNRKTRVYSYFNLPMVRTPPSLANSVADKPIYVNRVWNDAMHYIITFPKKYVPLGSEHTINVKLIPLMKDVILKRIKFNVLERITYVSKDLKREYEYDSDDPHLIKPHCELKTRERVVHLCELKTKYRSNYSASAEPFKEEVIKCPDNNLLFSCYEPKDDPALDDPLAKPEKSTMIASPLDINIALPFLTTKADKVMMTANPDEANSNAAPRRSLSVHRDSVLSGTFCPSSPLIGSLETQISHMHADVPGVSDNNDDDVFKLDSSAYMDESKTTKENIQQGYTSVQKALAPDSNFRHVQVSHRLQVSFRISKPDPKDNNRMHHYEVVVDTPLILLSAKCNESSIQLPRYDEIDPEVVPMSPPQRREITFRTPSYNKNGVSIKPLDPEGNDRLPSFEEAISASASPVMRSFSVADDPLSRANSVSHSGPVPSYEESMPGNVNDEYIPTLRIDDLVIDPANASAPSRPSGLRASLGNSFAPSSNSRSPDTNNSSVGSRDNDGSAPEEGDPLSLLSSDSASEAVLSSDLVSLSTSHDSAVDRLPSKDIGSISPRAVPGLGHGGENDLSTLPLLKNESVESIHGSNPTRATEDLAKILSTDLGDPKLLGLRHAY
ncbi:hypothetical protein C7M61_001490 [Candidozyma pseudohaemuli]|uniref:Arrestin C-terminal-like domain-containing protein n=1 Tax=Candidozyma pseudohaemuli TaxID=418784 RepID=A0A2P7YUP5_9ASCO|nr:hypothetical protein C7M61_001490 [[Candida] pseudohaemulonii]PSK39688.1 hypothetical protein C7M61_001490 [[Candida] pseudohaemulonii]